MWKVEVFEYYRLSDDSITYREFFNSKKDALDYCNSLKYINADVILEDMTPIGDGEYTDGEIIWIQKAVTY